MALKRKGIDGDPVLVGKHVHRITHQETPVSFRFVPAAHRLEVKLGNVTIYFTEKETAQIRAFITKEVKE